METNNMNIRARFEEIWSVPEGIAWYEEAGEYCPMNGALATDERIEKCIELDARLDTFTRCQETTSIYSGLVDDLITELEFVRRISGQPDVIEIASKSISRSKKIMDQKK